MRGKETGIFNGKMVFSLPCSNWGMSKCSIRYKPLGTWWAVIMRQEWQPNLLDDPHAMYCSAFVRYCYKEAGKDSVGQEISVSNTTPKATAQEGIKAGTLKMYGP